jgi:hypothetical protein
VRYASAATKSAPGGFCAIAANAASISRSLVACSNWSCKPNARGRLQFLDINIGIRISRIHQDGNGRGPRHQIAQQRHLVEVGSKPV